MDDVPQRLDFTDAAERRFPVPAEEAGARLDLFLARRLQDWSRAGVQRLIREGAVQLDGADARAATRLRTGAEVCVRVPRVLPFEVVPQDLPLDVLMEEEAFVVLHKPAGVAVHPGAGRPDGTLANALAYRYGVLSERGGKHRPGIVHRLDLDTSGVLVVAKSDVAHRALQDAFKARTVRKEYRALAYGDPAARSERIDAPLGRSLAHPERMAVRFDGGRESSTEVEVIERYGAACLLACRPETGRTHQIRVHLQSRRHPILGDALYAGRRKPPVPVPRLMLHALRLSFPHPRSGEQIEVEAPLPDDFREVVAALRALHAVD